MVWTFYIIHLWRENGKPIDWDQQAKKSSQNPLISIAYTECSPCSLRSGGLHPAVHRAAGQLGRGHGARPAASLAGRRADVGRAAPTRGPSCPGLPLPAVLPVVMKSARAHSSRRVHSYCLFLRGSILAVNVLAVNRPFPLYTVSKRVSLTTHSRSASYTRSPCLSRFYAEGKLRIVAAYPVHSELQHEHTLRLACGAWRENITVPRRAVAARDAGSLL